MRPDFKITHILKRYRLHIVWLAIGSAVLTWGLDLMGLVHKCPYCEVQRTVIGVLGLIALLPKHKNTLLRYVCYLIAFLGANFSADQILLHIKARIFLSPSLYLAICALILIGILTVMNHYRYRKT